MDPLTQGVITSIAGRVNQYIKNKLSIDEQKKEIDEKFPEI